MSETPKDSHHRYKEKGLVLQYTCPTRKEIQAFLSEQARGVEFDTNQFESLREPTLPHVGKIVWKLDEYDDTIRLVAVHRPPNMYFLPPEQKPEALTPTEGFPPLEKWEALIFTEAKHQLFPIAEMGYTVGAELEGPTILAEIPPQLQIELQHTLAEAPLDKGADALNLLVSAVVTVTARDKHAPIPASWTQRTPITNPDFFAINRGEYEEYVRKIQAVLFRMILEQPTNENQNPNYHLFRERWDYIAQSLGMSDFSELLHFAKQSGMELGFLYFAAHHVHVGITNSQEYPINIFFNVARALDNEVLTSSMLMATASTPAAYNIWLDDTPIRSIDARYALSGILPTTQRFTRGGYAKNYEELIQIWEQNTMIKGANTLERMAGFNEDGEAPTMHGLLRIRTKLGTIEFTGASSADPFATTIYTMMTETVTLGALMGLDLHDAFMTPSAMQGRDHIEKELFFQEMLTPPTTIEELQKKEKYIEEMRGMWEHYFQVLFTRIEEDLKAVSQHTPDEQTLTNKAYQKMRWYRQEILEHHKRIMRGFRFYYLLRNPNAAEKQALLSSDSSLKRWYSLLKVQDKAVHDILSLWWFENYEIPIWSLWYFLREKYQMEAAEIEVLLSQYVIDLYKAAEQFFRQRFAEVLRMSS